ncbi:TPA: hypothetical protein ACLA4J_002067, partial [Neisseria meningitidis]
MAGLFVKDIHRVSFSVETPTFRAVESEFIWEGRNPFQIRATHRAVLYVSSCVLKHFSDFSVETQAGDFSRLPKMPSEKRFGASLRCLRYSGLTKTST